ncbi:hypothetical protein HHL22_20655 [Hymenobacter sp. RP-2-7]|uniref:Uncharacterized protein n=1 Tax=Hymenobacter polaris TaxID=2682546 RepID=A0A7Y0FPP7_9BACT|nr:hypothetical protein [Hymenobacter polaris]NML67619.1 hypothetical protein [Hymenobacter polaris]
MPAPAPTWRPGEPGYGVVEYADGGHKRFIAFGPLSVACVAELCAVARKHGVKPTSTDGWLTQSSSQSEPKGT